MQVYHTFNQILILRSGEFRGETMLNLIYGLIDNVFWVCFASNSYGLQFLEIDYRILFLGPLISNSFSKTFIFFIKKNYFLKNTRKGPQSGPLSFREKGASLTANVKYLNHGIYTSIGQSLCRGT